LHLLLLMCDVRATLCESHISRQVCHSKTSCTLRRVQVLRLAAEERAQQATTWLQTLQELNRELQHKLDGMKVSVMA
jgi:hypothetical protein